MKKLLYLILLTLLFPLIAQAQDADLEKYNTPSFRIGLWSGSSFEPLAKAKLPKATLVYFKDSMDDLIEALQTNKIDSFIVDRIVANDLIKQHPDLTIADTYLDRTEYGMAFHLDNRALRDEFAAEIKKMKASGELAQLQKDWFSEDISLQKNRIAPHGTRGVLQVGTTAVEKPFSFYRDNKLVGLEIELVNRVAERLDYGVEWSIVDHFSFISAIQNKEIDIVAAIITINEERAKQVLFGEPDYEDFVVFMVKKK